MCANEIEGVEKLMSGGVGELGVGFSSDNVEVNAAAPENGNVKFTVTPKGVYLLLPCEDETVENTVDFHSVGYHRIFINAVVTSVKIATDKAALKIYSKLW